MSLVAPAASGDADEEGGTDATESLIIESAVTTVPSSCIAPEPLRSVFVGTVSKVDANFVLYNVESERFGTVAELLRDGVLTVRYPIDTGLLKPLLGDRSGLLGALLLPLGAGLGLLFLLAATRFLITGAIRGMRK